MIPKDKTKHKQRLEFVHPFWKAGDVKQISPANVLLGRRKKKIPSIARKICPLWSFREGEDVHMNTSFTDSQPKEEQIKKRVQWRYSLVLVLGYSTVNSTVQFSCISVPPNNCRQSLLCFPLCLPTVERQ
ncbi:hypothetical protein CEXT_77971 [Caerostris extrusa]|uniref:Uncharacterized protein n=1 Tax=Caerostris extrusa TaxID=172846 RepID=A0AAV4QG21_CAEEX|nr:hypothetical protein CEXT_77971 [Caerostris extrusa]